jgi:hypothetical protein
MNKPHIPIGLVGRNTDECNSVTMERRYNGERVVPDV